MMCRGMCAVALLFVLLASRAQAMSVEGVDFAPRYRAGEVEMKLNNAALLRWKWVLKAYVAALYLGDGIKPAQVLSDVPKRLEIQYFWSIPGSDFVKATNATIGDNVDAATLARLRPRIDRLNALYRDVKPGDRYALTYVPGKGTTLSWNNQPLGTVEGADFAAAVFAIWLGKNAIDDSLRDELLAHR
jgi:Chalcone isomerase-like